VKNEYWIGVYRKVNAIEGELVALFRRHDVLPTRLDCLPEGYTTSRRQVVVRPAPITVSEGDATLTDALTLLDAVVNGSDEELGVVLERATAFIEKHRGAK
jgi:CBS domain-containing protein